MKKENESLFEWEKVCDLNEAEKDAFDKSNACRAACQELIKKLVHEWETAYIADAEMWEALIKKNDPDHARDKWVHKVEGDELFRRAKSDDKIEALIKSMDKSKSYREHFTRLFKKGDKP